MVAETETITPPAETTPAVTPSWRDSLPDDLKADKSLESFKDVPALAKSYVETKKLVGAKQGLTIPGEGATPEERKAFDAQVRKALGVPEAPDGYKVKPHEMMAHPEWNKEAQVGFLKVAHAAGMTPEQVNTTLGYYADFIAGQVKSNAAMEAEAKAELRIAWGPNFDVMMGAANRGISRVEQAAGLESGALIEATKGTDPAAVAKAFAWVEQQFLEHGFVQGEPIAGISADEARDKVATIDAELAKIDPNSQRASDLVNQKIQYLRAASRAAI